MYIGNPLNMYIYGHQFTTELFANFQILIITFDFGHKFVLKLESQNEY